MSFVGYKEDVFDKISNHIIRGRKYYFYLNSGDHKMKKCFIFIIVLSLLPFVAATIAQGSECRAQGIGEEEAFAKKVCKAATQFGLHPELVHSFGAGGVDVFISKAEAKKLLSQKSKLRNLVLSLTEWSKKNYHKFNAVEITIVGGDSKIARGVKLGTMKTKVTLY